MGDKKN